MNRSCIVVAPQWTVMRELVKDSTSSLQFLFPERNNTENNSAIGFQVLLSCCLNSRDSCFLVPLQILVEVPGIAQEDIILIEHVGPPSEASHRLQSIHKTRFESILRTLEFSGLYPVGFQ